MDALGELEGCWISPDVRCSVVVDSVVVEGIAVVEWVGLVALRWFGLPAFVVDLSFEPLDRFVVDYP